MAVFKPSMIRSDESEVQIVRRNSLDHREDLWAAGVEGDDGSTQCLHCAVSTCAVVPVEGGIWSDIKSSSTGIKRAKHISLESTSNTIKYPAEFKHLSSG